MIALSRGLRIGLTDSALDYVSGDEDRLVLPQPVNSVDSLLLDGFVPPSVHHENICLVSNSDARYGALTIRHCSVEASAMYNTYGVR